jgi:DNA-binding response OmpR family regulator
VTAATILIIDDNVNLAGGFANALERAGYRAHVAHTADGGLNLARAVRPQAIILDFQMPFVNGLGFLYRLRRMPSLGDTPVMVVTGATVTDETRAGLDEMRAVLRYKPLALADLLAETAALVDANPAASLPTTSAGSFRATDPRRC